MATKEKILEILNTASGWMSPSAIGEILKEPRANFQTQLDRMKKADPPLVDENEEKEYKITEAGTNFLLNPSGKTDVTQSQLGVTEMDLFINFGKMVGVVPETLVTAVATVLFNGEYNNLDFLWEKLDEMQIRKDLALRWFNMWKSHLNKAAPEGIKKVVSDLKNDSSSVIKDLGSKPGDINRQHLTHILDDRDIPQYLGPGLGDMTEKDAIDLSKARAMGNRRTGASGSGEPKTIGSQADDLVKVIAAVQELQGLQGSNIPKSWIAKTNAEGQMTVEELDPSKPNVVQSSNAPPASAQKIMVVIPKEDGSFQMTPFDPTQPLNFPSMRSPSRPSGKTIIIDRNTGEREEVEDGKPVIIFKNPQGSTSPTTPVLQFKDSSGIPITLDIDTYFRLEDHKAKKEREQESHEMKMDIMKTVKDLAAKGAKAAGRIAEREG